jgi:hypothetical protein
MADSMSCSRNAGIQTVPAAAVAWIPALRGNDK